VSPTRHTPKRPTVYQSQSRAVIIWRGGKLLRESIMKYVYVWYISDRNHSYCWNVAEGRTLLDAMCDHYTYHPGKVLKVRLAYS
jgi:hypothetical protein